MKQGLSDTAKESEAERLGRLYPILLCAYHPEYKERYETEREFLLGVFGDCVFRISHIGSTAVEGLISKPTIDILLELKAPMDLTPITQVLTEKGYIVNRPPNDVITYIKGYGPNGFVGQAYHIHIRNFGDHNELYFRDYLIANPQIAGQYGKLKLALKEKFAHDRDGYTYAKSEFVEKYTKLARAAYGGRYQPR